MRLILVIAVIINAPLVVNAVGQGASCVTDACDADFECIDGTGGAKTCLAKKGTVCANTGECTTSEPLVCGGVAGALKCLTAITAGATCTATNECVTDLVCEDKNGLKCLVQTGAPCTDTNECVTDLVCEDKNGFKCLVQTGAPCTDTTECVTGLVCGGITGALKCLAPIAAGAACTDTTECVAGLVCGGITGALVCLTPKAAGTVCTDTTECVAGLVCGGITSALKCLTPITAGATCTDTNECVTDLVCEDKNGLKCLVKTGNTCTATTECGPDLVCGGVPGSLVCLTPIAENGACTSDNECVSLLKCIDKKCQNSSMTSAPAVFAMVISVLLSLYGKEFF